MPKPYPKKAPRLTPIRVHCFAIRAMHLLTSLRLLRESRLPYFIKEISRHSGLLVVVPISALCPERKRQMAALTDALPKPVLNCY